MNLGRFHSALTDLRFSFQVEKTVELISALQGSLQQSISQQTPEAAKDFKVRYANLMQTLEKSRLNAVFPTRRKIFEDIGALPVIGGGLMERIEVVISENRVTPANAMVELKKISMEVTEYYKKIELIEKTFDQMEIEYDDLAQGEFEVGFSFPREVVGHTLQSLAEEFLEMDFALRTFQEIAGEGGGSPTVKTISASDWQVFLDSLPVTALCISAAIERVVALYKNNLEIRLIKKQLEEKNLPEAVTKPFQEHIEKTVKAEIKSIANQLVDEMYQGDKGRKNELKTGASQALRYIADRIDKGVIIEFHAEPLSEPEGKVEGDGADQKQLQAYESKKAQIDAVNVRMISVSKTKRADEPTLLLNYDKNEEATKQPNK